MRTFHVTTAGPNRLRLRELLLRRRPVVAFHVTDELAAESVLDCFKRAVRQELELLKLECDEKLPSE